MTSHEMLNTICKAQQIGRDWADVEWDSTDSIDTSDHPVPPVESEAVEVLDEIHEMGLEEMPAYLRDTCVAICMMAKVERLVELRSPEVM